MSAPTAPLYGSSDSFSAGHNLQSLIPPQHSDWEEKESTTPVPSGVKDIWNRISHGIDDPEMQLLARHHLPALLLSAKAPSTTKAYSSAWHRWEALASSKTEVTVFPARPIDFCLYFSSLLPSKHKSTTNSTAAAVKWVHSLAGLPSPTDDPLVKMALQGYRHSLASTPQSERTCFRTYLFVSSAMLDFFVSAISITSGV
ncbi:uncharacterized protein LOC119738002 [Patiria miniata]|uniref:Uncharacterized protein n=1 Tax=Patiria miniata TaxID=46514 RepID=A0A914AY74_PATMI|nr:uncharacterized protein LOC119738002 [Patiria miniata]